VDWISIPADERGDALVAAMGLGGVDYMFFNSGSEIMFMQEAIAKANALGRPAPRLVMMTHEYPTLNAALGYAAVTGRMAATAVHVDVGTQHYGCAIHTARHPGCRFSSPPGRRRCLILARCAARATAAISGCSRRPIRTASFANT
jgi:hypothetical protein